MKYAQTYTSNAAYEADDQKGYPHISLISGGTLIYDVTAPPVIDKKVLVDGMPPEQASANLGAYAFMIGVDWLEYDEQAEEITTSDYTVTINDFKRNGTTDMSLVTVEDGTTWYDVTISSQIESEADTWQCTFTVTGDGIPNTPYTVTYTPPTE